MTYPFFPFSALVGQERLRLGLLVAAVEPSVGGVLVSGTKGTGKSTAVRALRALLPELEAVAGCPYRCPPGDPRASCERCRGRLQDGEQLELQRISTPFVELPLNATEDRVAGTLDVERALRSGERHFEPGLLASANRGFLYVDEVNLLDDHLVDLLLDASSSGVHVVEREGVSHIHPARFVLVGTMNPEEGNLRPQFLDRFGLSVSIRDTAELSLREEIARRRLAFDSDPEGFTRRWASAETELGQRLAKAQREVRSVQVPDELISLAVRLATNARSAGHRAEITILKAGRAIAALMGKPQADRETIAEAARFVLPHRISAGPLDTAERVEQRLQALIAAALSGNEPPPEDAPAAEWDDALEESLFSMLVPGACAAGGVEYSVEKKSPKSGSSSPTD